MGDLLQVWQFAVPIALAAIGESVAQRSGVLDIGLEGKMLGAAFAGVVVSMQTGNPWLGLLAGAFVGMAMAILQGWFVLKLAADQVVVGTAMNLLALGVTGTLFKNMFGQSGQLLTVPGIARAGGIDAIMVFTLLMAPLLWLALRRTTWGLVIRAAGEYPKAAEAQGFHVGRLRLGACCLGGALAGTAGAYLSLGLAGSFAENMTAGRGFVAIALVTFGRWNPVFVILAAMLMGYLDLLQFKFQAQGLAVPYQLMLALPYVVALVVLVLAGKGTLAPAALGLPYKRGQ
jgi:simple sugar transport system permease protein